MIAVDTNLLVYAHRDDSPWHDAAYEQIANLAEGRGAWTLPWPCIHEFLAIVTHQKIYAPPTPLQAAIEQVQAWLESPSLVLIAESEGYWEELKTALQRGKISGPQVHDARVATLCILHGVAELWTVDRHFGRFPNLTVRNPLVG